jgi:hypothetical protein
MQRQTPMPPQLVELRNEAFNYVPSDPGWNYLRMMDQFTILRSDVKSGMITDPEAILTRAIKLDGELMHIFANVPQGWRYETVYTDTKNKIVWNGCYDIYYDAWISQIWNAMRSTRIMLNEMIRFRLIEGFKATPQHFATPEYRAQLQLSTNTCVEMRDGILRSVPLHCGYVNRKPFQSPYSSPEPSPPPSDMNIFDVNDTITSFIDLLADTSLPTLGINESFERDLNYPMIGGYFLIWPLYLAGVTSVSPPEVKRFVARTLHYVGDEVGIRQASNLAGFMEAHSMAGAQSPGGMKMTGERPNRPLLQMLAKEEAERVDRMSATTVRSVSIGAQ